MSTRLKLDLPYRNEDAIERLVLTNITTLKTMGFMRGYRYKYIYIYV